MTILIGLDIGTSSIRAVALDTTSGLVLHSAATPTPVSHSSQVRSEHDPEALWQASVRVLREVCLRINGELVSGLAISSMADTGVVLDERGAPLYPIVAWYDQRCAQQISWLATQITSQRFHRITGQRFSTSLGISKWLWLQGNLPGIQETAAAWLSVSDYVLWRLTGKMVTDYSLASRMGMLDQRSLTWSPELLKLAGLCEDQLPRVLPSGSVVGTLTDAAAVLTGLPGGLPCVLGGHDHLCAAAAAGAEDAGTLVDSCGTAESLLVTVDKYQPGPRLLRSGYAIYAHVFPGRYVLRGGLRSAGGAVQWLASCLAGKSPEDKDLPFKELMVEASMGIGRRAGPLWLPHLLGSGTPQDDPNSSAAMVGLKAEHERGDIFRGMLESLAFWLRQNLEQIEYLLDHPIREVLLVGGATRFDLLNQLKADVLNRPVTLLQIQEPSAVGAALLAAVGTGCFSDLAQASASLQYDCQIIYPEPGRIQWYSQLYQQGYQPVYLALQQIHHNLAAMADGSVDIPDL